MMRVCDLLFLCTWSVACTVDLAAEELPVHAKRVKTLSQYGITWTFENEVLVGQYVSGDYWVRLPATVTDITPQQTLKPPRHGTELNPVANREQPYDDRGNIGGGFKQSTRIVLPCVLSDFDVLLSTISAKELKKPSPDALKENYCRGPIQTAAILTAVKDIPSTDAFRPAYCGKWKASLTLADINLKLLPQLKLGEERFDSSRFQRVFDRPWIDHWPGWSARSLHPWENMPDYGREIASYLGMCSLLICTEGFVEKNPEVFYNYLQVAIDLYGISTSNNKLWHADGGHCAGRKAPILIAGHLFENKDMLSVKAAFQEDEQVYRGAGWAGQTALWRITLNGDRDHEHLSPDEWAGPPFKNGNDGWKSQAYRKLNAPTWLAAALAIEACGLKKQWNHDVFFEYLDRWVAEEETGLIDKQSMKPKSYKAFENDFVKEMWNLYHNKSK